ncbi:MAG: hypothetical protein JWQ00_1722 [Noviherbaspirillum sp.]|nr:hypothetical protein [Noviherbaspirillum sp.]
MDVLLIELVLWGGLLFFFWALKDGLGRIETDLDALGLLDTGQQSLDATPGFVQPDSMLEPIGRYQDELIYKYAVVNDQHYRFDRVQPKPPQGRLHEGELYVRPGLIYVPC